MGTTLTGTTPQDTYDSLIKVTDNGPLSGTAKYLSDGLGNDSALAVSTARVGVGTATPSQKLSVSGGNLLVNNGTSPDSNSGIRIVAPISTTQYNWMIGAQENINNGFEITPSTAVGGATFSTPALSILAPSGNVGIGTSSPAQNLSVEENTLNPSLVSLTGSFGTSRGAVISLAADELGANEAALKFTTSIANPYGGYVFSTQGGEKLRILSTGGITFNGDTAAANALDDYEEGTWTMGVSFGGGTTGITYNANSGTYTKVGRKVTISGYIALSAKGSSTGNARITGLPFTSLSGDSNLTAVTLWYNNTTFVGQFQGLVRTGQNYIDLTAITESGSISSISDTNFANNTEIILNVTYFV